MSDRRREWSMGWRRKRQDWRGWPTILTSQFASAVFHIVRTVSEPTLYNITKRMGLLSETHVRRALKRLENIGLVRVRLEIRDADAPRGRKRGRSRVVYEVDDAGLERLVEAFGDTRQEFPLIIDYLRKLKKKWIREKRLPG